MQNRNIKGMWTAEVITETEISKKSETFEKIRKSKNIFNNTSKTKGSF